METNRNTIKKILREYSEDLEFIDSYWKETNKRLAGIINKIKTELPVLKKPTSDDEGLILKTVNFSDMEDSWKGGTSDGLNALADKISHMIYTGKSDGIKRMIEKIATGRIKSLSKPDALFGAEYLGKGHFRWNNQAYVLTPKEIERVKEFFNL
jgi:hypothetical protein